MKERFQFVCVALIFFAVMEFGFSVLIRDDMSNFIGSIVINFMYLNIAFWILNKWFPIDKLSIKSEFKIFLIFGFVGLFIEWFLIGNSPWGNPQASQHTMFIYWGGAILFSRILMLKDEKFMKLRTYMKRYFFGFSLLYILGGIISSGEVRFVYLILGAIVGYDLMMVFYIWYFRILKKEN